jgi:hypothetical protein
MHKEVRVCTGTCTCTQTDLQIQMGGSSFDYHKDLMLLTMQVQKCKQSTPSVFLPDHMT